MFILFFSFSPLPQIPPAAATHHHASSTTGTKRLRDVEGDSSTSNDESNDKVAPQKRQRQDGGVFQVSYWYSLVL